MLLHKNIAQKKEVNVKRDIVLWTGQVAVFNDGVHLF